MKKLQNYENCGSRSNVEFYQKKLGNQLRTMLEQEKLETESTFQGNCLWKMVGFDEATHTTFSKCPCFLKIYSRTDLPIQHVALVIMNIVC